MNNIAAELSILGEQFQIACMVCNHAEELDVEGYDRVVRVQNGHAGFSRSVYKCPRCQTESALVLDRFQGVEAEYAIH